ncbi:hypothetical protein [Mongoliibacter sp.]|uniref:hypothetical protein n=1 Tax=Mongoliibacter sp. TaxID=2022438 RepID=UPI0025D5CDAB|nr:hypothetical protein [Mongoliibacter sp.]
MESSKVEKILFLALLLETYSPEIQSGEELKGVKTIFLEIHILKIHEFACYNYFVFFKQYVYPHHYT